MTAHPTDNALDELDVILKHYFFRDERPQARKVFLEWSDKRLLAELEKAHRANGTTDFDNATDEYIDNRSEELKGQV